MHRVRDGGVRPDELSRRHFLEPFFHELLALTKAFTIEDFTRALLAKKRLGLLVGRS